MLELQVESDADSDEGDGEGTGSRTRTASSNQLLPPSQLEKIPAADGQDSARPEVDEPNHKVVVLCS
jgi:hypothetical protein